MYIENLRSNNGFTEIHSGTTKLTTRYDYIIHVINLEDVEGVVKQFHHNLDTIGESPHQKIAKDQLNEMENELHTLLPRRKTRGLINAGGALMKFVFGTMDEEDRQNIEEHQKILGENNHQLIEGLNQQIAINDNFNKSLQTLKTAILADRQTIENKINVVSDLEERLIKENLAISQLFKISILKRKVENLQQTVASARLSIFSPSLLTREEIDRFKIDPEKLKNIRIGIVTSQAKTISLLIKIPAEEVSVEKSLIIPIPNKDNLQIDENTETVIRMGNRTYTFAEEKAIFDLVETRNCVIRQPCRMVRKTGYDIVQIDGGKVIAINANFTRLNSTCDSRVFNLQGHYYLHFSNCTIQLGNSTFRNRLKRFEQSFAIPPRETNFSTEKPLIFEDIVLNQEKNIRKIEELHYHKLVGTAMSITTIILLVGLVVTVIILCKQQGKFKVKITENRITRDTARSSAIRRNFERQEANCTTLSNSCNIPPPPPLPQS